MLSSPSPSRVFLVVVDNSPEMHAALRYACRCAQRCDGTVALLRVIPPLDLHHFIGIGDLMKAEAKAGANALLSRLAADVTALSGGHVPLLFIRTGDNRRAVIGLIEEEPSISTLVLASNTEGGDPGPLVSALSGNFVGKLRIPLTIVPGHLTPDQIDQIS